MYFNVAFVQQLNFKFSSLNLLCFIQDTPVSQIVHFSAITLPCHTSTISDFINTLTTSLDAADLRARPPSP